MKDLFLEYRVIGSGKITLVIESGIGGSYYDWYPVIEEIKEYFTIIQYHRAGYGKSEVSDAPRTTRNIAIELNGLLEKIGIKEKFILMGHSYGGLCVQHYAKMFPEKLMGVVLLDSTSPNFKQLYNLNIPILNSFISIEAMIESCIESSQKSKKELKDKCKDMIASHEKTLSVDELERCEEFFTNPLLYKIVAEEFANWGESSEDIKKIGQFPDIPLIIIARDNKVSQKSWLEINVPEEEAILYEVEWRKLQKELSTLSSKGNLIIAEDSDHEIYLDRPEVVVECLKKLL